MTTDDPTALTPVERIGDLLVKRDDTFVFAGSCGGKVRTCLHIALAAQHRGKDTLVTAGSRQSPQVNIVAGIARELGMDARCHVPAGDRTPEIAAAILAGATIVGHRPGYNSVIVRRAREDVWIDPGAVEVPFGMETPLAVTYTAAQVANLPFGEFERIVVPVGSGMSLAGIIQGLEDVGRPQTPILGVQVGADPTGRLDRYAPMWRWADVTLRRAPWPYHHAIQCDTVGAIVLDPIYEAKCGSFLQAGDLFWVVGRRETATADNPQELGIGGGSY